MNYLDHAPQTNRSQPIYPDSQSVLRTITRQGYKFWSPLIYHYNFILFILQALFISTRRARWLRPFTVDDSAYPQLANLISYFSKFSTKTIAKKPKFFYLLCNSKEESRTINYGTRQYKSRRRLKGPRRPTEPSDLLDFEKAARLRQRPQPFRSFLQGPRFI